MNTFFVHPGTGTYMAVSESIVVDLDDWAADSGFTKLSDDLYVNDDTGHQYDADDLIRYYIEVAAPEPPVIVRERVSLDPPGPTGKTKMVLPPPDLQQVVTYRPRGTAS